MGSDGHWFPGGLQALLVQLDHSVHLLRQRPACLGEGEGVGVGEGEGEGVGVGESEGVGVGASVGEDESYVRTRV